MADVSMKLNELFQNLDEAISLTKYSDDLITGTIETLIVSLPVFNDDMLENELMNIAFQEMASEFIENFRTNLEIYLDRSLRTILKQNGISDKLISESEVIIDELPEGTSGLARGTDIILSNKLVDTISSMVYAGVKKTYLHEYKTNEYVSLTDIVSDDGFKNYIRQVMRKPVGQMMTIFIHEIVHVIQNCRQFDKGRRGNEYRSYLDKGEHNLATNTAGALSDPEKSFDARLYYSSPQEIASFAHEAALEVIRSGDISANNITNKVVEYYGRAFPKPTNRQEQQILNRYLKLTYLEVQRYLESKNASK